MNETEQSFYFVLFGVIFFGFLLALFAMVKSKERRNETAAEFKTQFTKDPLEALLNISLIVTVPVFFGWLFLSSMNIVPLGKPFRWMLGALFVQVILLFVIPNRKR